MQKTKIFKGLKIFFLFFMVIGLLILSQCDTNGQQNEEEYVYVVVGGDGQVKITYDEGINWSSGNSGHTQNHGKVATDKNGHWMAAALYVVGSSPTSEIHISDDKGATWTPVGLNIANHFIYDIGADKYGFFFIAVGTVFNGPATLRYSQNGGNSWTLFPLGNYYSLEGIDTDDLGNWVTVGGESTILWSSSPALQWNAAAITRSFGDRAGMVDVAYVGSRTVNNVDEDIWIAVGGHYDTQQPQLFRSMDKGHSWNWKNTNIFFPAWHWFRAIGSDDTGTAVVVGDQGTMIKTTDFGDTWTQVVITGLTQTINDIATNFNGHWLATLDDGSIIFSNDLVTWTRIGPIVGTHLTGVAYGQ